MKRGLTLIETLVSLGIASIVFLIVSSLLVTFYTTDTRSKQLEVMERTKNDTALLLSNSVRWATAVNTDGSTLTTDGNNFYLSNGRLYKNSEPITSTNVNITQFQIKDYTALLGFPSLEIKISMNNVQNPLRTDEMKVVISMRKTLEQSSP